MVCKWVSQTMSSCWAPRQVGNIGDEPIHTSMASLKNTKLIESKHQLSDSDSEADTFTTNSFIHFPRFIVMQSKDSTKLVTKVSPFLIEKQIFSTIGTPKSVKKLKDQTLLLECFTKQQKLNLLKHSKFFDTNVRIFPRPFLNSSKGVIRCRELSYCESLQEIICYLRQQGVSDVKRICAQRNGEEKTHKHLYFDIFFSSSSFFNKSWISDS